MVRLCIMSMRNVLYSRFRFRDLRNGEVIRNYVGHSLAVTCVALNDSNIS